MQLLSGRPKIAFIGLGARFTREIAAEWLRLGCELRSLSEGLPDGVSDVLAAAKYLGAKDPQCELIEGSLLDFQSLESLISGVNLIYVHLEPGLGCSEADPLAMREGLGTLLMFLKRCPQAPRVYLNVGPFGNLPKACQKMGWPFTLAIAAQELLRASDLSATIVKASPFFEHLCSDGDWLDRQYFRKYRPDRSSFSGLSVSVYAKKLFEFFSVCSSEISEHAEYCSPQCDEIWIKGRTRASITALEEGAFEKMKAERQIIGWRSDSYWLGVVLGLLFSSWRAAASVSWFWKNYVEPQENQLSEGQVFPKSGDSNPEFEIFLSSRNKPLFLI